MKNMLAQRTVNRCP